MRDFIKKNLSFVKFCIVGSVCTLLDMLIYIFFVGTLGPIYAKTFSMCCSMILSYILNKVWSFSAKKGKIRSELVRYIISQVINLSVNVSVNYVVLKLTDMTLVAFLVATGMAMLVNYILQRCYVFRN